MGVIDRNGSEYDSITAPLHIAADSTDCNFPLYIRKIEPLAGCCTIIPLDTRREFWVTAGPALSRNAVSSAGCRRRKPV